MKAETVIVRLVPEGTSIEGRLTVCPLLRPEVEVEVVTEAMSEADTVAEIVAMSAMLIAKASVATPGSHANRVPRRLGSTGTKATCLGKLRLS